MNNAWNFNGNNRNLNNNNVNNAYQVGAVSNLSLNITTMNETEFFAYLTDIMFNTRRNKRRGRDSVAYEANWPALLVRDMDARLERTLRIDQNYAFLVSLPRWREIMATSFGGRMTDHEICDLLIPLCEQVLSFYTFNNRKGKGSMAAMNQVIEHINEVTQNYTQPARIIKLDLKGYFPNALWNYAEQKMLEVLQTAEVDEERRSYIAWLIMIATHCNPAAHCELRTPKSFWREHIEPEKSILQKPEGIGAAIGRLLWQTAMGLYINDDIKWLTEDCGIKAVCFVDDIVMVVPEHMHEYALSLFPALRQRFAIKNVCTNDKKFYDQPYQHGLEFLGSHIKTYRIHLNNKTYGRAIDTVRKANADTNKYRHLDRFVSQINSYTGLLKGRTDYRRTERLIGAISDEWWQWLRWDKRRQCLSYQEGHRPNQRLNKKYHLKLKALCVKKKNNSSSTSSKASSLTAKGN